MKLHPDAQGWTDVCEDCFDLIYRHYDGSWIAVDDAVTVVESSNCLRHRPMGIDPPKGAKCPHGGQWAACPEGCIDIYMEYVPKHGHEMPTSMIVERLKIQEYPTTEGVRCCHCRKPIFPSQYWSNRWYDQAQGRWHTCKKAANGYHEPTVGAADGDKIKREKTNA